MDLPINICASSGNILETTLNKPSGLLGHWSFDDKFGHDESGNNIDALQPPLIGPPHCKII
jgi:hypothetical protein